MNRAFGPEPVRPSTPEPTPPVPEDVSDVVDHLSGHLLTVEETNMANEVKPGWKTSEAWLCLLVVLLGSILPAMGVVPAGGTVERVAGLAVSVLAALGYTAARARVKMGLPPGE